MRTLGILRAPHIINNIDSFIIQGLGFSFTIMSAPRNSKRKGDGQRLNDAQRLEIIGLLEQPKTPSMRNIARQFGVDEKVIRNLKANKNGIRERARTVDQATQAKTFRVSQYG